MTKPKYEIGDRLGGWKVMYCKYSSWCDSYVYDLKRGKFKLTLPEASIENFLINHQPTKKLNGLFNN